MFGKHKDPTASWPEAGQAPVLDLGRQAVGPLRLGDPFDGARAFGRPRRLRGPASAGTQVLEYDGFELEFRDGRLVCAKFEFDAGEDMNIGDIHMSRAVKPLDALVWFGEPSSDSTGGGGLRWIDFARDGATLALEFDGKGLSCVQLYVDGYA